MPDETWVATRWAFFITRSYPSNPRLMNMKYCAITWLPGREKLSAKVGMWPPR